MSQCSCGPRSDHGVSRRGLLASSVAVGGALAAGAALRPARAAAQATPVASPATPGDLDPAAQAAGVLAIVEQAMTDHLLMAAIIRVTVDGEELVTAAFGETMPGVAATTGMRFRNGAIAISVMSTVLLQLVDQEVLGLDDPIDAWLPDFPDADLVTPRMLANMTAGYPDHVQDATFLNDILAHPFREWTQQELIDISFRTARVFPPGANWDYSHTNYVILGQVMAAAAGQPLGDLIQSLFVEPLGLTATAHSLTAEIPEPVLHGYSAERRPFLKIPGDIRFIEESTTWSPSWTLAEGAIQTMDIQDMTTTMDAIGSGELLSEASYQAQMSPDLMGFGEPLAGCPNCRTLNEVYSYGLGIVFNGDWMLQNPLFFGYGGLGAYLPSRRMAISVMTTYTAESYDEQGDIVGGNIGVPIFIAVADYLAPEAALHRR